MSDGAGGFPLAGIRCPVWTFVHSLGSGQEHGDIHASLFLQGLVLGEWSFLVRDALDRLCFCWRFGVPCLSLVFLHVGDSLRSDPGQLHLLGAGLGDSQCHFRLEGTTNV